MADHSTDGAFAGSLGSLGKASSGVAFQLGYHESPLRAFVALAGSERKGRVELREFPDLTDAVAWARKQLLAVPGLRICVNLCEVPPGDEEHRCRGMASAEQLRDQAEAGGTDLGKVVGGSREGVERPSMLTAWHTTAVRSQPVMQVTHWASGMK